MAKTLWLDDDTKERFDRIKPYETVTQDEFLNELLDEYENGN